MWRRMLLVDAICWSRGVHQDHGLREAVGGGGGAEGEPVI